MKTDLSSSIDCLKRALSATDDAREAEYLRLGIAQLDRVQSSGVIEVPPTDPAGFMNRDAASVALPCQFQPGTKVHAKGMTGTVKSVEFSGVIGTGKCVVIYHIQREGALSIVLAESEYVTAAE